MSVTADTDQEEVARLATKHRLLAVPVVDGTIVSWARSPSTT